MKTVRQYIDDEMIEDKSERRWVQIMVAMETLEREIENEIK